MQVVLSKLTLSLEIFPVITSTLTSHAVKVSRLLTSSSYEYSPIVHPLVSEGLIRRFKIFIDRINFEHYLLMPIFFSWPINYSKETSYIKDKSSGCKVIQYFVLVQQYSN